MSNSRKTEYERLMALDEKRLDQMQAHVDEGGTLKCDQELIDIIRKQHELLGKAEEALDEFLYVTEGKYPNTQKMAQETLTLLREGKDA